MDHKFLDKVMEQIMSETMVDYDKQIVTFPFPISRFIRRLGNNVSLPYNPCSVNIPTYPFLFSTYKPSYPGTLSSSFSDHCKEVYSLNDDEAYYLWGEYSIKIKVMLSNKLFESNSI
jgi:hypothetical protein